MKTIELWWSRELGRIAQICRTSLHLLDDDSIEKVREWALSIVNVVDRERARRAPAMMVDNNIVG